ncbi:hypothetical protein [Plantactinospora veratri]
MTVGDAAFGADRSWFERAWKGAIALIVAVAVTVAAYRHHRWRKPVTERGGSDWRRRA